MITMHANHRSIVAAMTALGALLYGCGGSSNEPSEASALTEAPSERRMSRLAAEQIDEQSGGRVIWIDAGCCAGLDSRLPESIVFGLQAALGQDMPLFVHGADGGQAQRLLDRLDELGVGRRGAVVMP